MGKKKSWPRASPSHSGPAPGARLTIAATPPAASGPSAGSCSSTAAAPTALTGCPPMTGAYVPNGVCHALPAAADPLVQPWAHQPTHGSRVYNCFGKVLSQRRTSTLAALVSGGPAVWLMFCACSFSRKANGRAGQHRLGMTQAAACASRLEAGASRLQSLALRSPCPCEDPLNPHCGIYSMSLLRYEMQH